MRQHRKDIFGPFRVALTGLVFTFKTQRHMRFHLYVVLTVVLLGLLINLPLREMLVLLFTISLVLVAEMFNSAIEATVRHQRRYLAVSQQQWNQERSSRIDLLHQSSIELFLDPARANRDR